MRRNRYATTLLICKRDRVGISAGSVVEAARSGPGVEGQGVGAVVAARDQVRGSRL